MINLCYQRFMWWVCISVTAIIEFLWTHMLLTRYVAELLLKRLLIDFRCRIFFPCQWFVWLICFHLLQVNYLWLYFKTFKMSCHYITDRVIVAYTFTCTLINKYGMLVDAFFRLELDGRQHWNAFNWLQESFICIFLINSVCFLFMSV